MFYFLCVPKIKTNMEMSLLMKNDAMTTLAIKQARHMDNICKKYRVFCYLNILVKDMSDRKEFLICSRAG